MIKTAETNSSPRPAAPAEPRRHLFNRWLEGFLTIIAGVVVAVIAWNVIARFMHIVVLLLAGFVLAYLLGPAVDRLAQRGVPRGFGTALAFLALLAALGVLGTILVGPLISQLQGVVNTLPTLASSRSGVLSDLDSFFQQYGIPLQTATLQKQLGDSLAATSTSLLGGTLAVVSGLVTFVTDLLLIIVIAFYFIIDGQSMRNTFLRLLPARARDRWFFVEATLNTVLGGYIRGQVVVALTVGVAAGGGSALLGVQYPLVIGLLAFLFEFIPLIGPVLGMVPAVVIALFQPFPLVLWVIIYFIVLQQVESNVIVPRISGHAVGLHPLAVILALIAGIELGGLGGALISVPLVGVLYVIAMAIYTDVTHQTGILVSRPRPRPGPGLRLAMFGRRAGETAVATPAPGAPAPAAGAPADAPIPAMSERLNTLTQEQALLKEQFEADTAAAQTDAAGTPVSAEHEAPRAPRSEAPPGD